MDKNFELRERILDIMDSNLETRLNMYKPTKTNKMKNTQPDEKEYSSMTILGLTKEDLVVISIALVVLTTFLFTLLK